MNEHDDVVLRLPALVVYADLRNGVAVLVPRSAAASAAAVLTLAEVQAALLAAAAQKRKEPPS